MVGSQQPVVTGDAVVLDVQVAQLPVRALSILIDIVVIFVLYVVGVMLWATTLAQFDSAFSAAVLIIFTVLALVGYPVIFETATRGRTLGKMALGLRVVSDDGGPERFRQALFRALAGVIEIWMLTGGPAVICSLISPKGKRIGDIFAGTLVITERAPRLSPPPTMPPRNMDPGWTCAPWPRVRCLPTRVSACVTGTGKCSPMRTWKPLAGHRTACTRNGKSCCT